jgi:hypothetical protein
MMIMQVMNDNASISQIGMRENNNTFSHPSLHRVNISTYRIAIRVMFWALKIGAMSHALIGPIGEGYIKLP